MSQKDNAQQLKPGGIYAWVVAIVCALIFFTSIGMIAGTGFSVLGPLMIDQWGITEPQFSTVVMVRTVGGMIGMFLCGIYYKKLSLRMGLAVGVILGIVGFMIFAFVPGYTMKLVASGFTGLCYGFAGMIPIALLLSNWFNKYRNFVIGISYCASGCASMVLPGLLTFLATRYGLETGFICECIFSAVVAVLAIAILRDKPEMLGRAPVGTLDDVEADSAKAKSKVAFNEKYKYTFTGEIIIYVVSFLIGGINYTAYNHFSVNLSTQGWNSTEIATILSCAGFTLLIGKPFYGAVVDRWGARKMSALFYAFVLVAMILACFANVHIIGFQMASLAIYGIGGVLATSGIASYCLDLSDEAQRERITRYSFVIYSVAGIVFSWFMGMVVKLTGVYTLAYATLAVITVITYVLVMIAYRMAKVKPEDREV